MGGGAQARAAARLLGHGAPVAQGRAGDHNIEAAACGTPPVAADSTGLRESVIHDRTGLLIPYGDTVRLADALGALAADPERVAALGAAGRAFAEGFSWERSADLTEAHLAEVAGQR